MDIELGKKRVSRIKFFDKKCKLNESEVLSDIAIAGKLNHSIPHVSQMINQIKDKVNVIMFANEIFLKFYLETLNEEERSKILVTHLSSYFNFKSTDILDKYDLIIFAVKDENQDNELLSKFEEIYKSNIKKHTKIVAIHDAIFFDKYSNLAVDKQIKTIKPKNVSFFYLSYELHFSIQSDIHIIHKHSDPEFSRTKFLNLYKDKKGTYNIRDLRDLDKSRFIFFKKEDLEVNYCYHKFEVDFKEKINLEDYLKDEMLVKINNF